MAFVVLCSFGVPRRPLRLRTCMGNELLILLASAALIILELPHPLGPVAGLDAAGFGPAVGRVVLSMPLECPQLFQAHLARGSVDTSEYLHARKAAPSPPNWLQASSEGLGAIGHKNTSVRPVTDAGSPSHGVSGQSSQSTA